MLVYVVLWEMHWRAQGYTPNIDNSKGLWSMQRTRLIEEGGDSTAFIGVSRTLFNIDLETWASEMGTSVPIQLASMKSAPIIFLRDLAEDEDFSGFVVIGVTPAPFFNGTEDKAGLLEFYKKETPGQKWGQRLSMILEDSFAFMEHEVGLFSLLNKVQLTDRPGTMSEPQETPKISNMDKNRQAHMWWKLEQDPAYQRQIQALWGEALNPLPFKKSQAQIDLKISEINQHVSAIRNRGGAVVFVRFPSSHAYLDWEQSEFPRDRYWDELIRQTNATGIHFEDYPALTGYDLPDWSHLSADDAARFTNDLVTFVKPVYLDWKNSKPR